MKNVITSVLVYRGTRTRVIRLAALFGVIVMSSAALPAFASCPPEQLKISRDLAAEADATTDEIDRLILLKRSLKVCPQYKRWIDLGKIELQLENYFDAAYAFESAVEYYAVDSDNTYTISEVQRLAIANAWLAETYELNDEMALSQVAAQEAVGAFESIGVTIPDRLLQLQARLDDAMSEADASVLARSLQLQHQRATRGIGVRPRVRAEQQTAEAQEETWAIVADYSGEGIEPSPIVIARNELSDASNTVSDDSETEAGGSTDPGDSTVALANDSTGVSNQPQGDDTATESRLNLPVLFDFDSANLSEQSRGTIDQLALALGQLDLQGQETILVLGHTDSRGPDTYNLTLSERRATAVAQLLSQLLAGQSDAVPSVVFEGRGESELRYGGSTKDDHRRNRRVEVVVRR